MKLFFTSKRILRSFKILGYVSTLSKLLQSKNFTIFVLHTTYEPKDRILLHKHLNEKNLTTKVLPKNVTSFFFKEKKYVGLRNLLSGNVMFIRNISEKTTLKNSLEFIFQQDYFSCHLLLWNGQLYNQKEIKVLYNQDIKLHLVNQIQFLKQIKI